MSMVSSIYISLLALLLASGTYEWRTVILAALWLQFCYNPRGGAVWANITSPSIHEEWRKQPRWTPEAQSLGYWTLSAPLLERCVAAEGTATSELEFSTNGTTKCTKRTSPIKGIRSAKVCHLAVTREALLLHSSPVYSVSMLAVLATVSG